MWLLASTARYVDAGWRLLFVLLGVALAAVGIRTLRTGVYLAGDDVVIRRLLSTESFP